MKVIFSAIFLITSIPLVFSQDTFSIVAVDSITGEVGSAGASCVDLIGFPGMTDHFLSELFPGVGGINSQASYSASNQSNARTRMNLGDTPAEIIDWLEANDVSGTPETRQYGIVRLVDESPQTAGYSGAETFAYSNHISGLNYAIQGNILLGAAVLDSMEARFLRAEGDLACKLMAAMQGANMVGADTRCAENGTSSLFAFLKVAQPDDDFGAPSFVVSVRTADGDGIEPIDSLQRLFDAEHSCAVTGGLDEFYPENVAFKLYPNPANEVLNLMVNDNLTYTVEILNMSGQVMLVEEGNTQIIDISGLDKGTYSLRLVHPTGVFLQKFTKY